jgi:hypothetical protein
VAYLIKLSADKTVALNGSMMLNWNLCGTGGHDIFQGTILAFICRMIGILAKIQTSTSQYKLPPMQFTRFASLLTFQYHLMMTRGIKTCSSILQDIIVNAYIFELTIM